MFETLKSKLPPMPPSPPVHEPERTTLFQLATLIGVAIAMHFFIASPVIASFALAVFLLKVGIISKRRPVPHSLVMILLTVFSLGLILFFYGGWNGQRAGISFLVLLVALKFLESRKLRDYYVVCLLLYFLAASSFLFNASIFSIFTVVLYTIAITAILFKISNPNHLSITAALKAATIIIAKALPLAVILFFFFPRISGDFGFLPSQDKGKGLNSLDNSLVAGEMAASAFDTRLAFRVKFTGPLPAQNQLYWRAKVMPIERTFQWEVQDFSSRNSDYATQKASASSTKSGQFSYEILHENSLDHFLPYLDYPVNYSKGRMLDDYSIFVRKPEPSTFRYEGKSDLVPSLPDADASKNALFTTTESKPTARLQALLLKFRKNAKSDRELVANLFKYFSDKKFIYSLMPPTLDEFEPLDDFIFNTQTGYCEHYASAFTTLARWLKVPARVVVGYQGGTLNQAGDYYEIKYSDAHAWSEVWLDDQWVRVDPTAASVPDRIEYGMDALSALWDSGNLNSNASGRALASFLNPSRSKRLMRRINDTFSNIGYQWNKWVVNYDNDAQRELLSSLGFKNKNTLHALLSIMGAATLLLLGFYFWQLIPRPVEREDSQKAFIRFTGKFINHGIVKSPSDTPSEFSEKAKIKFPHLAEEINAITRSFEQLRYGPSSENRAEKDNIEFTTQLSLLKNQVKRFKIPQ